MYGAPAPGTSDPLSWAQNTLPRSTAVADGPSLPDRLRKIRLLALDVDGVLTDGRITLSEDGQEIKSFSARDGAGLVAWHRSGGRSAIITARGSNAVGRRARELGIEDVVLHAKDKRTTLRELAAKHELPLESIAFVGDDLQDLGALQIAGVALSVRGCAPDVAERVTYVTRTRPGEGAVRELIELILHAQDRWEEVVASFLE